MRLDLATFSWSSVELGVICASFCLRMSSILDWLSALIVSMATESTRGFSRTTKITT